MSRPRKVSWKPNSPELEAARRQLFFEGSSQYDGLVSDPFGVHLCPTMLDIHEKIVNFKLRSDDIWIVTYPKCGTTWTQELVWLIMNGVDTQKAKEIPLSVRAPFFERTATALGATLESQRALLEKVGNEKQRMSFQTRLSSPDTVENTPSPRVIKTHLPIDMLPPNLLETCKVVFVARNPKDSCVSFYHHHMTMPDYRFNGDFSGFAQMYMDGNVEFGSYWTMLKNAWKYKDHPNMKIMWFEDMKKNLKPIIRELCIHLGVNLTEAQIEKIDEHLKIDNFRASLKESEGGDPTIDKFIRKGAVGDWKNYFTEDKVKLWDKWIADNLEGTDITMPQ